MGNIITEVRLLNVPLENDYKHTLYFDDVSAQTTYFTGLTCKKATECTYQRKEKCIRFPADYDELIGYNYLMYKNKNKWFYGFITKIEYVHDEMSFVYFETDVIQTWLKDYTIKTSFVEREHVNDDTIGIHTVPEQVETGDYICNGINKCVQNNYKAYIVASTIDLSDAHNEDTDLKDVANVSGKVYGGIYSGVRYYMYTSSEDLNNVIKNVSNSGRADAITSIFIAPLPFISVSGTEVGNVNTEGIYWGTVTDGSATIQTPNYKLTSLNGYTPTNKKLLTYPYIYMLMDNNAGSSAIYKYELFNRDNLSNTKCDFKMYGSLTPGFSGRIIPLNYNGVDENNSEGLTMCKFPVCNWTTDVYMNWLTQNSINIGTQALSSTLQIVGGIALMGTGAGAFAGAGMIAGGLTGVANSVGQIYQHELMPPQAEGNLNSGDVTFTMGNSTFTAYQMSIKKEYAQIIDEYFNMYGYKINRVKIPLSNHRQNYWFTKTIDANIDGAIPNGDLQKIKECYNRGITFWKSATNIGNYNVSNSIV